MWVLALRPGFDLCSQDGAPSAGSWAELSLRQGLEGARLDATLCVVHADILVLGGGHSGEQLDHFGDAAGAFWAETEALFVSLSLSLSLSLTLPRRLLGRRRDVCVAPAA